LQQLASLRDKVAGMSNLSFSLGPGRSHIFFPSELTLLPALPPLPTPFDSPESQQRAFTASYAAYPPGNDVLKVSAGKFSCGFTY
jgi:hypothetical protein